MLAQVDDDDVWQGRMFMLQSFNDDKEGDGLLGLQSLLCLLSSGMSQWIWCSFLWTSWLVKWVEWAVEAITEIVYAW